MISIVIPLHNEAQNLEKLLQEIDNILQKEKIKREFILIDDGSQDHTWEIISQLASKGFCIKGIRFTRNFGKEAAIYAGLSEAEGNPVLVMDGDGQHPPSLIPKMLEKWRKGALVVEAFKVKRQPEPFWKAFCSKFFYYLFRISTGLDLYTTTDFKLLDQRVVKAYLALPENHRFFRGLVKWLGFPTEKVYFTPHPRKHGSSSWPLRKLILFAWNSLIAFTIWPLRFLILMGIIGIVGSTILTIQTLYYKLTGKALPGFSTVIILQLSIGSGIILGLGLLGEYIARIYEETKRRPIYVILERFVSK